MGDEAEDEDEAEEEDEPERDDALAAAGRPSARVGAIARFVARFEVCFAARFPVLFATAGPPTLTGRRPVVYYYL